MYMKLETCCYDLFTENVLPIFRDQGKLCSRWSLGMLSWRYLVKPYLELQILCHYKTHALQNHSSVQLSFTKQAQSTIKLLNMKAGMWLEYHKCRMQEVGFL